MRYPNDVHLFTFHALNVKGSRAGHRPASHIGRMTGSMIKATSLRIVLGLAPETELSDHELAQLIDEHAPYVGAEDDLPGTRDAAAFLTTYGYLEVLRAEPGLYRVR
jgi:hypothetical protein